MPPTPYARRFLNPAGLVAMAASAAVLCALALAVLSLPLLVARAGTPATLTVSLLAAKSTATQSQYQAVAAGFAAQTQITVTFGDGTGINPLVATTDGNGGFTSFWTLNATNKYCGTLSATDGTSTATASFWVAPATDAQSGTACAGTGTGAAPTATVGATVAPTQTSATPVAAQAPPPPPAVASPPPSGSSLGTRVQHAIARIPGGLATVIAGSIVAMLILLGLIVLVVLNRNQSDEAAHRASRGMPVARGGMTPPGMPTRRTPAMGQMAMGRHPYDVESTFDGNGAGGPGASASNGSVRAPRGGGPVRTPPPWVGDPGATPGRTGSYRMPSNRAARHGLSPAAEPRWDRSRPGARARRDAAPDRDDDWPPDPSWR